MKSIEASPNQIIQFLRTRDYEFVRELGQGACGKTVLLRDKQLDELFVCKKYQPYSEAERQQLFENFVREVKILHKLQHQNVVRVFGAYLYPERFAGYILMEYVNGDSIDQYVEDTPDSIDDLFVQAAEGFAYLEACGVLHRDVRPTNLMVTLEGELKIIDLGFAKKITGLADFNKSISLNWWASSPKEFSDSQYDYSTEVYFVGKLFDGLVNKSPTTNFKYRDVLREMCMHDRSARVQNFSAVQKRIRAEQLSETSFDQNAMGTYREFADVLASKITKIDSGATYRKDVDDVLRRLISAYEKFMLEVDVPDSSAVVECFLDGSYYRRKSGMAVKVVRAFMLLLKSLQPEHSKIVLANLHNRLDLIPRYLDDDEIPF